MQQQSTSWIPRLAISKLLMAKYIMTSDTERWLKPKTL